MKADHPSAPSPASASPLGRLQATIDGIGLMAIAVSGGVDSMTLAHVAHDRLGPDALMLHAVSPAVPAHATERVRRHAEEAGWALRVIDAGEMSDPRYLANPVDRCFFCKTNLYARITPEAGGRVIASGTNADDLGDYRPGLVAARDHAVRHPYVETGLTKADVRAVAAALDLGDLAELPAAPCLSSRIETGIAVTAERLALIEATEALIRDRLGDGTIRCRVRAAGVVIELEDRLLSAVDEGLLPAIEGIARRHMHALPIRIESYRMGSAFLKDR